MGLLCLSGGRVADSWKADSWKELAIWTLKICVKRNSATLISKKFRVHLFVKVSLR